MLTIDERQNDELHKQRPLTPEQKSEAISLIDSGRPLTAVSREFRVPESVLRRWTQERRHGTRRARNAKDEAENVGDGIVESVPEARVQRESTSLVRQPTLTRRLYMDLVNLGRPYVSPGRSALNHWRLVAALTGAAMVLALAVGLARPPTYTADAELVVGKTVQLNNLASIPGLAQAGQEIASDYSRLISTEIVTKKAAKALHGPLGGSLSASPIPNSPVIQVSATAPSSAHAVSLANAGSAALVSAVNQLNEQQSKAAANLLQRYQQADQVLLSDTRTLTSLQQQQSANPGLGQQVIAAQTVVDSDKVELDAIGQDYAGTFSPSQLNEQLVQPVGPARPTGNNRKTFLELALLAAIVVGVMAGTGLAVFVDLRRSSRA